MRCNVGGVDLGELLLITFFSLFYLYSLFFYFICYENLLIVYWNESVKTFRTVEWKGDCWVKGNNGGGWTVVL